MRVGSNTSTSFRILQPSLVGWLEFWTAGRDVRYSPILKVEFKLGPQSEVANDVLSEFTNRLPVSLFQELQDLSCKVEPGAKHCIYDYLVPNTESLSNLVTNP